MNQLLKKAQDKGTLAIVNNTFNVILQLLKALMKADSENLEEISKAVKNKDYIKAFPLIEEELRKYDSSKTDRIAELLTSARQFLEGEKPQQSDK